MADAPCGGGTFASGARECILRARFEDKTRRAVTACQGSSLGPRFGLRIEFAGVLRTIARLAVQEKAIWSGSDEISTGHKATSHSRNRQLQRSARVDSKEQMVGLQVFGSKTECVERAVVFSPYSQQTDDEYPVCRRWVKLADWLGTMTGQQFNFLGSSESQDWDPWHCGASRPCDAGTCTTVSRLPRIPTS